MGFIKKHKIISFIIFLLTLFVIVEIGMRKHVHIILEKNADKKIEAYIKAQGLEDEERLEDPGTISSSYYPWVGKEIIFKNNPEIYYVYERQGVYFDNIYDYINPYSRLEEYLKDYEDDYMGISFRQEDGDGNFQYELVDEDDIYEGELDKDGNLLREIEWQ